jgi:hypothetical protein
MEAVRGDAIMPAFSFLNLPAGGSRDERGGAAGGSRAPGASQACSRTASGGGAWGHVEMPTLPGDGPTGEHIGAGSAVCSMLLRWPPELMARRMMTERVRRHGEDEVTEPGRPQRPGDGRGGLRDERSEDTERLPDLLAAEVELDGEWRSRRRRHRACPRRGHGRLCGFGLCGFSFRVLMMLG